MNKNNVYTFLLEYKGGTYLSQIKAESPQNALTKWSESLSVTEIKGLGEKTKEQLIKDTKLEEPCLIEGMSNVWCATFVLANNLALLHYVQTKTN